MGRRSFQSSGQNFGVQRIVHVFVAATLVAFASMIAVSEFRRYFPDESTRVVHLSDSRVGSDPFVSEAYNADLAFYRQNGVGLSEVAD